MAEDIRAGRAFEREDLMDPENREKRDRPASRYVEYLRGLESTLEYVRGSQHTLVVDLGAGTSRGISQIAQSTYGKGLKFIGTGLVFDSAVEEHIGHAHYRVTPAETMHGFEPASVGCFISLHGPFVYSGHPELVLAKTDALLADGGVMKICIPLRINDEQERLREQANTRNADVARTIESFFREHKYGLVVSDHELPEAKRTNRIFLAVKPSGADDSPELLARQLMLGDLESADDMRAAFLRPKA